MSIILLALACSGEPYDPLDRGSGGGDPSSDACPSGMVEVAAAELALGEWDAALVESFPGTALAIDDYPVQGFCVDAYMFPGIRGWDWPLDGLTQSQMSLLEAQLATHGRRLCSVAEILLASAGTENWRHPYDAEARQDGVCDPDDLNPSPIGTFPNCQSPLGVYDFEVRSTWARLDAVSAAQLDLVWEGAIPGGGTYGIVGGTSASDTYYAPSNFGIHFGAEGDKNFPNEGLRTCADLNAITGDMESAWGESRNAFEDQGTFAAWLAP